MAIPLIGNVNEGRNPIKPDTDPKTSDLGEYEDGY
jgi:hypothetical protein